MSDLGTFCSSRRIYDVLHTPFCCKGFYYTHRNIYSSERTECSGHLPVTFSCTLLYQNNLSSCAVYCSSVEYWLYTWSMICSALAPVLHTGWPRSFYHVGFWSSELSGHSRTGSELVVSRLKFYLFCKDIFAPFFL